MSELDELRSLVREVIRDLLPHGLPDTETVNLSTDADLAAFVSRLLDLDPDEREAVRSGRKRFRLVPTTAPVPPATPVQATPVQAAPAQVSAPAAPAKAAPAPAGAVRRIERGAVTERTVEAAARAGERLVLGRGAVLTPLARDRARSGGVEIERER
jgi:hypothetical protein